MRWTLLCSLIFASHFGWWQVELCAASSPSFQVVQAEVDRAIDQGAKWLLKREESGAKVASYQPNQGQSALALYAALKGGIDPESPSVQAWVDRLGARRFTRTYDTTCLILALATLDPVEHWGQIHTLANQLIRWQNPAGDWGYPSGADLSNTQYAALGLWKARQLGIRVEADVWQRLADCTLEYQTKDGSFSYSRGGSSGSASMTAAGAGTLAICEIQLRLAGALDYPLAEKIIPARNKAKRWLGKRLSDAVHFGSWQYYYLYGLERFGALAGESHLLGQDWYQVGAQVILAGRQEDGSWARDEIKTSFAVLFLARATAASHGPVAVTGMDTKAKSGESGVLCWLKTEGAGPMTIGVNMWDRTALRQYEWPKERGLGPRLSWVEYLCDGKRIAIQLADSSQPLRNRYFYFTHHFPKKGAQTIQARFHLELPPGAEHLPPVIESDSVLALVQHSLPSLAAMETEELGRKLSLGGLVRASASSYATKRDGLPKVDCKATAAVDGQANTAWIFKPTDRKRKLTLRLNVRGKVSVIQIHGCDRLPQSDLGFLPLRMLEVTVNHKHQYPLLVPAGSHSGYLRLDHEMAIYHLEIRVLTLGAKPKEGAEVFGLAGIAEVHLYSSE